MTDRRVSIPASDGVGWVVTVPELCPGETRPASRLALRHLEAQFAPLECPGCSRFVERAIEALSLALDAFDDEPPHGGLTD
jgi:hypothetical protein